MHLGRRLRRLLEELPHATRLGARLVVREDSAGGEEQREVGVRRFRRPRGVRGPESGSAARGREALGEQARGSGVVFGGARPEDAALPVDARVGDPGIVGGPARGRAPQLGEDLLCAREGEALLPAERLREAAQDLEVRAHPGGRLHRLAPPEHATLQVGSGPVLLGPLGGGEDDVGEAGGLGQEEVGDDQEVETPEALGHP